MEAGWEVEVPYTFTNRTGRTVFLPRCLGAFGLRLDRWESGRWEPVWWPVLPLCASPPIMIAAGAEHRDTLHFFSAPPGSGAGPPMGRGPIPATYRLAWAALYYHDGGGGDGAAVPLEYRTSNPFTLGP